MVAVSFDDGSVKQRVRFDGDAKTGRLKTMRLIACYFSVCWNSKLGQHVEMTLEMDNEPCFYHSYLTTHVLLPMDNMYCVVHTVY